MVATIPPLKHKSSFSRKKPVPGTKKAKTPALALVPTPPSPRRDSRSPSSSAFPLKIQCLLLLQKSLTVFSASLVLVTLGVYAWSVYVPKRWSQEFRKLEALQSDERQLVAMDETLKNQLAQQAGDPKTGLVPANPNQPLFLAPATTKTVAKPNIARTSPISIRQGKSPLAY